MDWQRFSWQLTRNPMEGVNAPAVSRLPGHASTQAPTQDAIDLPKMVQVVCRFKAP
jgi:hypothetical protein